MRPCPPSGTGSGVISSSSINVARTAGSVLEPRMVFSLPHCPTCLLHHPAPFHLSTPPNLSQTVRPPLSEREDRVAGRHRRLRTSSTLVNDRIKPGGCAFPDSA